MKRADMRACQARACAMFRKAGIVLTPEEESNVEVADFGLGRVDKVGLQLVTYVNTARVCAKEMALFPGQTCPEHRHVGTREAPGKEETFRCRYGKAYLYVEGEGDRAAMQAILPETVVTVFHEIALSPGQQYTILPGVRHWFQGGAEGAVISEFSTHSTDETDVFQDADIVRLPVIDD